MKRKLFKIFAAMITVTLISFTYINEPVVSSSIPVIQPNYKSILKNIIGYTTNNEDFLLAILGTDEREDEASRSDVIMLLKYNGKENKAIVVSVPRDCKISISGRGLAKINAASAFGGSKLQVNVLENLFKIKNVRYVHINFKGFKEIVDALGGIKINAKKDFRRDWGEEDIFAKKGDNLLFGDDLLEYVTFRHDAEGDFGRIKRQQEVLLSFASSVLDKSNITKLPKVILLIGKNTDSDMDIFFMMNHIRRLKNLDSLEFEFYTLNTYSEKSNGIWYEIIDERDLETISDLLQK